MQKTILFLLLLALTMPALAQPPSALISHLEGHALLIVSKDDKKRAAPLATINSKTLIELRGGSTMTVVYFETDNIEEYRGPALIGIGEKRGKVFHGPETARKVLHTNSALVRQIDPEALTHPKGSGKLAARRVSDKTELSWTTDLKAPYQVYVVKPAQFGQRQTQIWMKEVSDKKVFYDGPKLDENITYFVEVASGSEVIGTSPFRAKHGKAKAISEAEVAAKHIRLKDPTNTSSHVLLSLLYNQHGLNEKAVDALNQAVEIQPQEEAFIGRMNHMMDDVNKEAQDHTAYARGYYQAVDNYWGTNAYYDPYAWRWHGWD